MADIPGLDEAKRDGAWALAESILGYRCAPSDDTVRHASATIDAAAPVLVRAALLAAADEFERDWTDAYGGTVAEKLRKRAESITAQAEAP